MSADFNFAPLNSPFGKRIITRGDRFPAVVPDGVPVIRIGNQRDLNQFYEVRRLSR